MLTTGMTAFFILRHSPEDTIAGEEKIPGSSPSKRSPRMTIVFSVSKQVDYNREFSVKVEIIGW